MDRNRRPLVSRDGRPPLISDFRPLTCDHDCHHRRTRRRGKKQHRRRLAERLGFAFLDTGAMYRAVTLAALRQKLTAANNDAIATLADELQIEFDGSHTLLDGEDVSAAIRATDVSPAVTWPPTTSPCGGRLVELQQQNRRRIATSSPKGATRAPWLSHTPSAKSS